MEEEVARLVESGGDPLKCVFGAEVSAEFAQAVLLLEPDVKTLERDGMDAEGNRTRWRGVKNTKTGEVQWFDFSQFCPPLPPEFCEE